MDLAIVEGYCVCVCIEGLCGAGWIFVGYEDLGV